jgi:uracil-DNA glycosylase
VPTVSPNTGAFERLRLEALGCTACRLCEGRTQVVFGMGDPAADLLFVGEGPGAEEDRQGLPFVGRSGKLLDRLMAEEMGLTRDSVYIANVVKCRPPDNRDPKPDEIAACRPYLEQQVALIEPRVIVTLGNFPSKLLLDPPTGITRLRGRAYRYGEAVLVPTLHPAAVLRGGGAAMANMRADLVRAKTVLAGGSVELTDAAEVARTPGRRAVAQ